MKATKDLKNGNIQNDDMIGVYFKKNSLHITPRDLLHVPIRSRGKQGQAMKNDDDVLIMKKDNELDNSKKHDIVQNDDGYGDHAVNDTVNDAANDTVNDTVNDKTISIDNLLVSLEESCFIISDTFVKRNLREQSGRIDLELRKKKCCNYFVFRYENDQLLLAQEEESVSTNDLLKKFSSFSLSTPACASASRNVSNDNNGQVEEFNKQQLLELASRFVTLQIKEEDGTIDTSNTLYNKSTREAKGVSAATTGASSNSSSGSGGKLTSLFGMSKKIYSKASTAVTSVLASYDLAEDPHLYNLPHSNNKKGIHGGNCYNDEDDDDALFMNEKYYSDNIDLNHDDAKDYYLDESNNNLQGSQQKNQTLYSNTLSPILFETDKLWSVNLIIDCWSIILHHADQTILTLKADSSDIYEQLTTVTASEESSGSSESVMNGIILNRTGDGKLSFLVFCQEAGFAASSYSSEQLSLHHSMNDVGKILENISLDTSLDILLLTLLATNNAVLSTESDAIVLIPSSHSSTLSKEKNSYIANDVDIAGFKLSCTIQSLEKRINTLTDQSEALKKRALSSKQAGNTKIAIMHMKRRQILVNEIDRSSTSLLNLEAGLHSLKRAHGDAQILKAYNMMNSTMKLMREETSLSHVDEVMDEFHDGEEEFQQMRESLGMLSHTHDTVCDIDELEKELQALGEENGGGDRPSDEGTPQKVLKNDRHSFEDKDDELKDSHQLKVSESSSLSSTMRDQSVTVGR